MSKEQHEITQSGSLLSDDGSLRESGFARNLILNYDRSKIKAKSSRIKEWDYYFVSNGRYGVCLTIDDNGYMGMLSATLINFENTPWEITKSDIIPFTFGKIKLPASSKEGISKYVNKKSNYKFEVIPPKDGEPSSKTKRHLTCTLDDFKNNKPLYVNIMLENEPPDSMVIATPYLEKKNAFYYNQKINNMEATGYASFNGEKYDFNPKDSFGLLDWGRGVWTYENTWYWGSASGFVNGHKFGFNIGYGFGNTEAATENMLFYDGKSHKLTDITFNIPCKNCLRKSHLLYEHDFYKPWTFTSSDNRFEMNFIPIIDRASCTDLKIIMSDQHQVFGHFTGKAVLDDGTIVEVKDFFGFAEKVHNKW